MRKLYDVDPNDPNKLIEVDVPTEEEITAQIEQKVGETKAEYDDRVKELEADANPNWREARKTMAEQTEKIKKLEAQGKTINEAGEVVDLDKKLDENEIIEKAKLGMRQDMLKEAEEEELSQYDEQAKKVIKDYYDIVKAKFEQDGNKVNSASVIRRLIEEATSIAFPKRDSSINRAFGFRGKPPTITRKVEGGLDEEKGSSIGKQYPELRSLSNKKK